MVNLQIIKPQLQFFVIRVDRDVLGVFDIYLLHTHIGRRHFLLLHSRSYCVVLVLEDPVVLMLTQHLCLLFPGRDGGIFLPCVATGQRWIHDGEAPAEGLHPPSQLAVRGEPPLADLPRAGLHHKRVHETGHLNLSL